MKFIIKNTAPRFELLVLYVTSSDVKEEVRKGLNSLKKVTKKSRGLIMERFKKEFKPGISGLHTGIARDRNSREGQVNTALIVLFKDRISHTAKLAGVVSHEVDHFVDKIFLTQGWDQEDTEARAYLIGDLSTAILERIFANPEYEFVR